LASRVLGFSNGELSWGTICRVLMKEMATIRHRQIPSGKPMLHHLSINAGSTEGSPWPEVGRVDPEGREKALRVSC